MRIVPNSHLPMASAKSTPSNNVAVHFRMLEVGARCILQLTIVYNFAFVLETTTVCLIQVKREKK